jgi:phosphotransacetylase
VTSEIAGRADILLAPTMESAVMVVRTLTAATGALAAGLVLGALVPIVVAVRNESMESRMASCVLASLLAPRQARRRATGAGEARRLPAGETVAAHLAA